MCVPVLFSLLKESRTTDKMRGFVEMSVFA